ncbi:hypothetical protein DFH06DRAFT_768793 [Mycena polygramma]|nr:hypothetical protein DFH06DRAFT_768793 [Mycena polygramma]
MILNLVSRLGSSTRLKHPPGDMSSVSPADNSSSILSLPPEIFAVIFERCLPSKAWPSPKEAPLLLAQICRRWREICLEMPTLWASVAFDNTRSVGLLETWLSRARNRPLTISLESTNEERGRRMLQAIKLHSSQWHDVHFTLPWASFHQLHQSAFPLLQRLTLLVSAGPDWDATSDDVIIDAPLLLYAEVQFPCLKFARPLEQLATLHYQYQAYLPEANDLVAFLQWCPNLLDLSCVCWGGWGSELYIPPRPPLELCSVRALKLHTETVLPQLTLPCLERLEISSILDVEAATPALQAFVSRSSCDVQFLSVSLRYVTVPQVQSFLRAVNSILQLKLCYDSTAEFELHMQALQCIGVLPHLKHLELPAHRGDGNRYYFRHLLDMLWWRQRHASLESLELFLGPLPTSCSAAEIAEFQALAEAGMQLHLTALQQTNNRWFVVPFLHIQQAPSSI